MSSVAPRHAATREILVRVEGGQATSQRVLARELGIALGLTNLLLKQMARKGWVRLSRVKPNRVRYLITPAGIAAKARLTRAYIRESVSFYRASRDRIREALAAIACSDHLKNENGRTPVAFYGAGAAAEIAWLCLQGTTLELTALVDPIRDEPFFGIAVCRPEDLTDVSASGRPFSKLIVMPSDNDDEVRRILHERGVAPERVVWL